MSDPTVDGKRPTLIACRSADDVRRAAVSTETRLMRVVAQLDERILHDQLPHSQPSVAQQLGHLGQSLSFYSEQILEWIEGRRVVLGRPESGDADELDAFEVATEMRLAPLVSALEAGLTSTRSTLSRITDAHLHAWITEIDAGRRPLISYLRNTVLGHTDRHVFELERTLR